MNEQEKQAVAAMNLPFCIPSNARGRAPRLAALGLAATLALSACAPGSGLPKLAETAPASYTLGAGEEVRIVVFGQTELTGRFTVNDSGTISVPLLGDVPARGKTTDQLAQTIATDLEQRKLLNSPSVSVEITKYRPVFVLGEVKTPGQYPYEPGMTALTLVAIAGGFTYRAQTGYVSVLRKEDGQVEEGQAPRGEELRPGDVVTIFERYF
ncbi:MAG TPA: polysaccharide biosynthesis/export family protein [Acidisoma sp.]|uniref:polysaccharide biosynthesis/export family protein n=1 Tax=Acidisoma sp. TaxID=1872115 RepID=UPI002BE3F760|nr:polysaccharide biosynthesis/export family protein [Acidisoma sp.]HTH99765.1 polysaccharide biosynthesis/export family protein [Acidisoma sp.]